MSTLDISHMIESGPIIRLSQPYNIRLLEKIKGQFSELEQNTFILNLYCYLNYDKTDFVVDLDSIWKWLGFNQKYNAERILEKHFVINHDYQITNSITVLDKRSSDDEKRGGYNIKKILLTIHCFKSLCLKAQTKKASEIHNYYIKLEEILYEVIEEEATELKQQLMEHKRLLDEQAEQMKQTPEQEKHKLLIREFGIIDGSLVYIVRVKTLTDGYIIKIGESRKGIKGRWTEFKQRYGEHVLFLDCFLVNKSAEFERFLHTHKLIRPHKVNHLPGHETENELFQIGPQLSYATLLDIIHKNIRTYNYSVSDYDRLKLEYDKLHAEYTTLHNNPSDVKENEMLKEILETNRLLLRRVNDLETSQREIIERVNASQTKTMTKFNEPDSHIGPRLQKINPTNLTQIVKVYETVTECLKEDPRIKRPSINKAIRENTIYCGFRWQLVDRALDPTLIYNIQPTKETKLQHLGYIAKLDKDKQCILHVYLDRKTAASLNHYKSSSALDTAVKNATIKDGYYYQLFEECDEPLKAHFLEKTGPFLLYKQGVGKFDHNGYVLEEFICKDDCVKKIRISQKSLAKVLDKDRTYDGFYFRSIGSKLSV